MRPLALCGGPGRRVYACTAQNACARGPSALRLRISGGRLLATRISAGDCVRLGPTASADLSGLGLLETPEHVACCAYNDRVFALVFGESRLAFRCAFVDLAEPEAGAPEGGDGVLTVTCLQSSFRAPEFDEDLCLSQFSENQVILAPLGLSRWQLLTLGPGAVEAAGFRLPSPGGRFMHSPPCPLGPGEALVPGGCEESTTRALFRITTRDGRAAAASCPPLRGDRAYRAGSALLFQRFAVFFGGVCYRAPGRRRLLSSLVVFDKETGRSSTVAPDGDWHPGDTMAVLLVGEDRLFVLGGTTGSDSFSLPFAALCQGIRDKRLRIDFYRCAFAADYPGFPVSSLEEVWTRARARAARTGVARL